MSSEQYGVKKAGLCWAEIICWTIEHHTWDDDYIDVVWNFFVSSLSMIEILKCSWMRSLIVQLSKEALVFSFLPLENTLGCLLKTSLLTNYDIVEQKNLEFLTSWWRTKEKFRWVNTDQKSVGKRIHNAKSLSSVCQTPSEKPSEGVKLFKNCFNGKKHFCFVVRHRGKRRGPFKRTDRLIGLFQQSRSGNSHLSQQYRNSNFVTSTRIAILLRNSTGRKKVLFLVWFLILDLISEYYRGVS